MTVKFFAKKLLLVAIPLIIVLLLTSVMGGDAASIRHGIFLDGIDPNDAP